MLTQLTHRLITTLVLRAGEAAMSRVHKLKTIPTGEISDFVVTK